MALHSRFYTKDEELGKRDDDFRPKQRTGMAYGAFHGRRRRFVAILILLVLAYYFIKNIPTDLGPADLRLKNGFKVNRMPLDASKNGAEQVETILNKFAGSTTTSPLAAANTQAYNSNIEPTGPPERSGSAEAKASSLQYYDGPIKFYRLLSTIADANVTSNVLFATSSLKSLANLLPLACDMAAQKNNRVNVAIMSRDTLSIDDLRAINNVDQDGCEVFFHDARPDYAEYSMDIRHEAAVSGGLTHINNALRLHAVIVDDESVEDASFSRAIRTATKTLFKTLIEVPQGQYEAYKYMCMLDSSSLAYWHVPTVEIVVHAQKDSAGGLIKLLRTLAAADYKGIRMPKITIDLATTIPPALNTFLNHFRWPPRFEPATKEVDPVTIRHHVQTQRLSTEQAAIRVVEAFYPASFDHHVLMLSPQLEMSPQYFRYLHYAILQYKYAMPKHSRFGDMMGIALDIPASDIAGKTDFVAPVIAETVDTKDKRTSFLYQAPSSSSLLIFGDKWVNFHDYLSNRITASHSGEAAKTEKIVSETEPAWMEYLLELMRARAWMVYYPARNFATKHNELAQIPEEFTREEKGERQPIREQALSLEEPFLLAPSAPNMRLHPEEELSNPLTPLHETLPLGGKLPVFSDLPFLSHDPEIVDIDELDDRQSDYVVEFRHKIGGCDKETARRPRIIEDGSTDDLFCLPGLEMRFDVQAEFAADDDDDTP